MKILSISFMNLNSLKGVHTIRFDEAPFTESSLFAITGQTGAGKTTILDALTAALYGRVHRHDKDLKEMMSRYTAECYSEVEFEVKDKAYRAKWSLKRSRGRSDGAFQGEKMELSVLDTGEFLGGHTTTGVKQAIKEICDLDYDQFLRSVILSQGDFASFLLAKDNERSELLEKITDTAIYAEISRFIFFRQKEEKEKLERLQSKIGDAKVLSTEDRNVHECRLQELNSNLGVLKKQQDESNNLINWLIGIEKAIVRKGDYANELTEQQLFFNEKSAEFELLRRHQEAVKFKPALTEVKTIKTQIGENNIEFERLQNQMPNYKLAVENAVAQQKRAIENITKAQLAATATEPVLVKVAKLDNDLSNLNNLIQQIVANVAFGTRQLSEKIEKREEKKQNAVQLTAEKEQLQIWLTEHEHDKELGKQLLVLNRLDKDLSDGDVLIKKLLNDQADFVQVVKAQQEQKDKNQELIVGLSLDIDSKRTSLLDLNTKLGGILKDQTIEEIEKSAGEIPELVGQYDQLYRLANSYGLQMKIKEELVQWLHQKQKNHRILTDSTGKLSEQKLSAERQLADLRELAELQQRIKNYEDERKELIPEEPCPLCGSVHHPYAEGNMTDQVDTAINKRRQQELLLDTLNVQLHSAGIELNTLGINIQAKLEELQKAEIQLKNILSEFSGLQHLISAKTTIEQTAEIAGIKLKYQQKFQQIKEQLVNIRVINNQIITAKDNVRETEHALLVEKGKSGTFDEKIKSANDQIKNLEVRLTESRIQRSQLISAITALFEVYGFQFNDSNMATVAEKLQTMLDLYNYNLDRLQQLEIELVRNQTELLNLVVLIKEKSIEQQKNELSLQEENKKKSIMMEERTSLFGDKDPVLERERLAAEISKARQLLDQITAELKGHEELLLLTKSKSHQLHATVTRQQITLSELAITLQKDIEQFGIQTFDELETRLLPDAEEKTISAVKNELELKIGGLKQQLVSIEKDIKIEQAKQLTEENTEQLTEKLGLVEENLNAFNQEIGMLVQLLKDDDKIQKEFSELVAQENLQKIELSRWSKISTLIGSDNGRKFSRFAQGLTLARLVDLANIHLNNLNERYQILKSKTNDLELLIVDSYQADAVRPMATLSGGESFIVSLALALGLSDLASRKVQINSLFIDEGFGTLDAETLDTAISALENLQTKGKTIGIISHVEALKERIGTQIQVSKQAGGWSKIKTKSYQDIIYEL